MSISMFSANTSEITAAGGTLEQQAQTLQGASTLAPVAGAAEYPAVTGAVSEFLGNWTPGLTQLATSMSQLGQAARGAAQLISATDAQNANAWSGVGSTMPSGRGVPIGP